MPGDNLTAKLTGGRGCSTGQALAAAAEVLNGPELFAELFSGLAHENSCTRMRAAYALSKVADARPGPLAPYTDQFIDRLADPDNSHLCRACLLQTVRKLELTPDALTCLKTCRATSGIVKAA